MHIVRSRAAKVAVASGSAVAIFFGGMAWAGGGALTHSGKNQVQVKAATSASAWSASEVEVWEDVFGAKVTVQVPDGGARFVVANFMAESECSATSWCGVRIVARKASGGSIIEMHPRVGTEFGFDDAGGAQYEAQSVQRVLRLTSGGNWNIFVQARVDGTGDFRLDDWSLVAEVAKP